MEKIYEYEENNQENNGSKFKQVMKSNVPHHFSALLILVAFASFLAIGFRGHESYAINPEELQDPFETVPMSGNLPETTTKTPYREIIGLDPTSGQDIQGLMAAYNATVYNTNIQVFCIDKSKGVSTAGTKYHKSSEAVDKGIVYILSQHDAANKSNLNQYQKTWITQTAIWLYQMRNLNMYKEREDIVTALNKVETVNKVAVDDVPPTTTNNYDVDYNKYIKPLLEEAKNANAGRLDITKANDSVTVTSDNKYYKTPLITVNGLVSGSTYSLKLTNAPEGTKVYKPDGTEITDLNTINATDNQFYLLSPLEKVTEKTKTVSVAVTGSQYTAVRYNPEDTDLQPLVILTNDKAEKGLDLNYSPSVPDTSMNTAQSIYFIGLVILLCGLGIIYANAKPKVTEE